MIPKITSQIVNEYLNLIFDSSQSSILSRIYLFIYLGFYVAFNTVIGHITTGSWKVRGNQYIQFIRVLYCKMPTNGKQLPAFPLEAVQGTKPRPQRWEARVLPLCHRDPPICTVGYNAFKVQSSGYKSCLTARVILGRCTSRKF